MIVIIVVIIIILIVYASYVNYMSSGSTGKTKIFIRPTQSGASRYIKPDDLELDDNEPSTYGLNELEQTTQSRGMVPTLNQPDHTSNLWKCDQSQYSIDGQSYEADICTPLRSKVISQSPSDISRSHLTSRFSTERSAK